MRRLRVRRSAQAVPWVAVAVFLLVLAAAYFFWRDAFTVVLAVGGFVGALVILYEVRLTKRIAQAEFIRDLNDGFTTNENIDALWRKLLLGEEVVAADRHLMSTYLTFFETVYLLLRRHVIDFALIDDLFRNRFFKAVGDPGVQRHALIRDGSSFLNIHALIADWHGYLTHHDIRLPDGYYAYAKAKAQSRGYRIEKLDAEHLPALLELQSEVIATLTRAEWLRDNTPEMFEECLREHHVLGAWDADDRLVGAAILYDGGQGKENIRRYFTEDADALAAAINLKLVLLRPEARGGGLARALVELLEQEAIALGKSEVLCTVHPGNRPSAGLFASLGYRRRGTVRTAYGRRHVLVRPIPAARVGR